MAKEEAEATTRVTKDAPRKKLVCVKMYNKRLMPQEDDTIEIVERYDSSDE